MNLFTSYRSLNSGKVDNLVAQLRALKKPDETPQYNVWLDKDNIAPGKDWWEAILDAIINCKAVIFMVSRDSVQNVNCRAELSYARKRNRPIIPIVLEGEYAYNPITGKNDIDYWAHVPNELVEQRSQLLFYHDFTFVQQFESAIAAIQQEPQRWRDMSAPKPPDPRPATEANSDMGTLYDQACDFAFRLELETAERYFQRLVNANDPDFGDEAFEWVSILRDYGQIIRYDSRGTTRYKALASWPTYLKRFPKPFVAFFDPKGFQARYLNGQLAETLARVQTAAPLVSQKTQRVMVSISAAEPSPVAPPASQPVKPTEPPAKALVASPLAGDSTKPVAELPVMVPLKAVDSAKLPPKLATTLPPRLATTTMKPAAIPVVPPPKPIDPALPQGQKLLLIMLDPGRPAKERAKAGEDINQFGDPRPGVIDLNFGIDYWCKVPSGAFQAGIEHDKDNKPRKLTISYNYCIGKYPVTYAQYKAFVDDPNGYRNPQWWKDLTGSGLAQQKIGAGEQEWPIPNHPTENVSWYDAMAFCAWLNARLTLSASIKPRGHVLRLPTEEEWEKAARGTDGFAYPWGNSYQVGYANINESSVLGGTYLEQTTAVGIYPQGISPYGLFDAAGNVLEWILNGNMEDDRNHERQVRGGSWYYGQSSALAASHNYHLASDLRDYRIGFRLAIGPLKRPT